MSAIWLVMAVIGSFAGLAWLIVALVGLYCDRRMP